MGRYDLRPIKVHDTAALLLKTKTGRQAQQPPAWFDAITDIAPAPALVRTIPKHHRTPARTARLKKATKMFHPRIIKYDEDETRQEFFADHPWELARPRIVNEEDGRDLHRWDWSKAFQLGRPMNGEAVVQRQRWLSENTDKTRTQVYDQARKELYRQRHFEAIEQRVAHEEALAVNAEFGMNALEVGMQLEKQTFEKWKVWAKQQVTLAEQARSAAYTSFDNPEKGKDETTPEASLDEELSRRPDDGPSS